MSHSHTNICWSHGWLSDGGYWRHNSLPYYAGGNKYRETQDHQLFLAGDGLNKYVHQHYTYGPLCG